MKYEKEPGGQWAYPRFIFHISYFILALTLASCASQQPPPGGPVDTTRPRIDSVMPHHRELNVPTDTKLYFQFDHDVDQSSFMTAFSMMPYLNGTPKFRWSGRNIVTVTPPTHLKDSTTYTVQLTRDLKTLLLNGAGSQLAAPFFLTFSTGPIIDTGKLSGYLLTPINSPPIRPSDLFIFAYDMSAPHADTLNFTRHPTN